MSWNGTIKILSGLSQAGADDFPLVHVKDIQAGEEPDDRLDDKLTAIDTAIGTSTDNISTSNSLHAKINSIDANTVKTTQTDNKSKLLYVNSSGTVTGISTNTALDSTGEGLPADAKAVGEKIAEKLSKKFTPVNNVSVANKWLTTDSNGNVVLSDMLTANELKMSSASDAATIANALTGKLSSSYTPLASGTNYKRYFVINENGTVSVCTQYDLQSIVGGGGSSGGDSGITEGQASVITGQLNALATTFADGIPVTTCSSPADAIKYQLNYIINKINSMIDVINENGGITITIDPSNIVADNNT